jgi:hypothetical protein
MKRMSEEEKQRLPSAFPSNHTPELQQQLAHKRKKATSRRTPKLHPHNIWRGSLIVIARQAGWALIS